MSYHLKTLQYNNSSLNPEFVVLLLNYFSKINLSNSNQPIMQTNS